MAGNQRGSYHDVYLDEYADDIFITVTVTIPLPTIDAEWTPPVVPDTVSAPVTIPTPAVNQGLGVSPAAVAVTATIPTPTTGLVAIYAKDLSFFYRVIDGGVPLLVLPLGNNRSGTLGLKPTEGWEKVSSRFVFNGDDDGHAAAMVTVASAWDAEKDSATATLLAAIDAALTAAGYRDSKGNPL